MIGSALVLILAQPATPVDAASPSAAALADETPEAEAAEEAARAAEESREAGEAAQPDAPAEDVRAAQPAEVGPAPVPAPKPVPAPEPQLRRTANQGGPPFYTPADESRLRQRFGLKPAPGTKARQARLRCLIADPTCGFNAEVNATAGYAFRARQGSVDEVNVLRWNSGRAQYDLWINFPAVTETEGDLRFTRMTIGPKGGVIGSDSGDLWGNVGFAARYWFGRGRLAPTIEFSSAITFQLRGKVGEDDNGKAQYGMRRSPAGVTADIGVGLGGFGAIVVGGQYDSPLAREEVPEALRVSTSGMFFVGFRGNILWGAPAAAALATHILAGRNVEAP